MVEDFCRDLDDIKKDYDLVKKKFNLPSWEDLEENFDVSKAFNGEGGIILRDIRRKINEKITSYLHLLETLINPQGTPMFLMNSLKVLEEADWKEIRRAYKGLARLQFKNISADLIYSSKKEAELIKISFDLWEKEKTGINKIIETLDKKYAVNNSEKKKSYFG